MRKMSEKVKKAYELIKDDIDCVTGTYESDEFVEFDGEVSGDHVCYRVYDNGKVFQR